MAERPYEDHVFQQVVTVAAGAAAQTAITSSAVNMAGFEGVTFIVPIGPITTAGVQSLKIQQSSDDGSSDNYSDILGSSQTIADSEDNTTRYVDVFRPEKQYLKLVISRATQDSTFGAVTAIKWGANRKPVTQTALGEAFSTPAEGTA